MTADAAPLPVAVLTGGTRGLGRFVLLGLAKAGRRTVLVARDAGRADEVRRWATVQAPGAAIEVEIADLSDLSQTRAAGERIASRHAKVSLLVNNAGLFEPKPTKSPEGFDRTLAVNVLSPAVLTRALLASLLGGAPSRIVNVGSTASEMARLPPEGLVRPSGLNPGQAYAQSKLALMLWSFDLARRLEGTGVSATVVHPGVVATELVRTGGAIGAVWKLIGRFALSAEDGADTPLFAALDPSMEGVSGVYLKRRRPARPNRAARDPAAVQAAAQQVERLAAAWLAPWPSSAGR